MKDTTREEIIKRFDEKFPEGLCGKGWGCDNCGACYNSCIDIKDAKNFLFQEISKAEERVRSEIVKEIDSYYRNMIEIVPSGNLPFVVFMGKADESEKKIIYEQALNDVKRMIKNLSK